MPDACLSVLLASMLAVANPTPPSRALPEGPALARVGAGWLSTATNEYNLSTDAAETLLVFGRSTRADFHDARVWIARREGKQWSEPALAPFSEAGWRDSDPWLTPDGRWLYFVSNRPAAGRSPDRDDLDLWRVSISDGRFGVPEHLAAASSTGEELGPEVHGEWLVFNSTRPGGPAQLALYRARLVDKQPGLPEALPAPFNDGLAQGDLSFSPDGQLAVFWSIRGDSREPDLFAVRRHGETWSPAIRLPAPLNAPGMDFTPAFTADGKYLRWASQRRADADGVEPDGTADVYQIDSHVLLKAMEHAE